MNSKKKSDGKKVKLSGKKKGKLDKKQAKTKSSGLEDSVSPKADPQNLDLPAFPIVGLGASAGGLEALEEFFRAMPADSGMGFVVVIHQAPKHVSLLPELLSKCTKMEVQVTDDGMTVQPNCVYLAPARKNVDLLAGRFHLAEIPEQRVIPLPIDYFFRSLANDRKESAIAVVLSGTGTDGTVGLSAIKGNSGLVAVQSVASAKFSGMPQNAIDSGWADYVLPPHEIPAKLVAYARGPYLKQRRTVDQQPPAILASLPEILLTLRRRCGHDFSGYKSSTICRRVERRMNVHQLYDPKHYHRFLEEHEPEAGLLFKELLIGVTSFFRDPWAFESLAKKAIMQALPKKGHDTSFRIWVPGCARGQEAYSLAILLRECMDELKIHLNVQIFATDLDHDAIESARTGLFSDGISSDVSAQRLAQFFTKEDSSYRIRQELRDWLVFATQNVIHDPPFTKLDLISCRNLLIYLQSDLQRKLLNLFHYSLRSGGCLLLGTSETIGEFTNLFEVIDSKAKVFHRKDALRSERSIEFPISVVPSGECPKPDGEHLLSKTRVEDAISKMLLTQFAPPTVIVNDAGEIVHIHGRTGKFLELAPGGPPKDITTMAREGLELELSSALRKATIEPGPIIHKNVPVRTNGDSELVNLTVQRITEPPTLKGLLRVSFEIAAEMSPNQPKVHPLEVASKLSSTDRERDLATELQHTRESLQRTIEELDASNEEMKSTNEELQSTNEELQSTNEELETSKEELQSLNEELQTVNGEFQAKINDLSRANDDMMNLLNSTDIATIFLDNQLCIKRYTERAKQVVHLIPTDVGRPLQDLTSHLKDENLVADGAEVLQTMTFKECEVRSDDGRWMLMRILPYRTSDDRIDGLVMTFIDIDEMKRNELARDYAKKIVETVREPFLILDGDFRVCSANDLFYTQFQVSKKATVGESIFELGNGQWDIPALRELLESIEAEESSFVDFEVHHDFPDVGVKRMLLNARRISDADGKAASILLAIEEVPHVN